MARIALLPRRSSLDNNNNNNNSTDNEFQQDPRSSRGGLAYMSESNFDTNMVIILAALLCALICALGLNSIVRCAMRCSRRMVFQSAEDVAVRLANTGLKRKALRSFPITVYSAAASGAQCSDCPICLAEFVQGDKVRILPKCNHVFHVKCVDTWLLSHSSCPTCRQCLLEISPDIHGSGPLQISQDNNGGAEPTPPPLPRVEARPAEPAAEIITTAQLQIPTQFYI